MKEYEPCRRSSDGRSSTPSTTATEHVESGTAERAVVRIGGRPVVEIGTTPIETTTTPQRLISAIDEPDREWDRVDDYAMTGYRAYRSDMDDLSLANTEARLARRGGVRFG